MNMNRCVSAFAVVFGTFALPIAAPAAVITGATSDAQVNLANPANPQDGGGTVAAVGSASFAGGRTPTGNVYHNTVYVFQLPSVGALADPFAAASFTMTIASTNDLDAFDTGLSYDLYGLAARPAAAVAGGDFFAGAADATDATVLQNNFINFGNTGRFASNVTKTTSAAGSAAVLAYLNASYAGGANAGQYVFLRVNVDRQNANLTGITNYAAEAANESFRPQITYTLVPEPGAAGAAALAAAAAGASRRRRAPGAR